jgi:hypothetical protein
MHVAAAHIPVLRETPSIFAFPLSKLTIPSMLNRKSVTAASGGQ